MRCGEAAGLHFAAADDVVWRRSKLGLRMTKEQIFDVDTVLAEIIADPSRFGIRNTTNECILTPSCVNGPKSVQDTYLFWDDVHPTTFVHEYLAEIVGNQLLAEQTVGGQAHENRSPYLTLNFCIAMSGIFPTRN